MYPKSDIEERIIELLAPNKAYTRVQLVRRLKRPRITIHDALMRLMLQDMVDCQERMVKRRGRRPIYFFLKKKGEPPKGAQNFPLKRREHG